MNLKRSTFIILLLVLVLQIFLRLPFLGEPLEGDEGVYASIGQGILAGEIPYRDFFDHKPPVIYYVNALIFKFFGQSLLAIRLFAAIFGLLGTLGVFWIGYLIWGEKIGMLSAAFYAVFSGGPMIEGAASNTESFMVVFIIFGLLTFVLALKSDSRHKIDSLLLLSGFFSGLAAMTKQVALLNFLVILGFLLPYRDFKKFNAWIKSFYLAAGFMIVPLFFSVYFWIKGGLWDFINFAFLFNFGYIQSGLSMILLIRTFYIAICENSVIWVLAFASIVYILLFKRSKFNLLIVFWAIFSCVGIMSGGHYFGHYYIQAVPALCLLSGYALDEIRFKKKSMNLFAVIVLFFLSFMILINEYEFYFKYSPDEISIQKYGHPYNVIAKELGRKIKKETSPGDYVLEIGLPQIHFYSRRRSPGKYYSLASGGKYKIYLFGRMIYNKEFRYAVDEKLREKVNQDLTKGLKNSRTRFVIFQSKEFIPKGINSRDFKMELSENFVYSKRLSSGVLVFERRK